MDDRRDAARSRRPPEKALQGSEIDIRSETTGRPVEDNLELWLAGNTAREL